MCKWWDKLTLRELVRSVNNQLHSVKMRGLWNDKLLKILHLVMLFRDRWQWKLERDVEWVCLYYHSILEAATWVFGSHSYLMFWPFCLRTHWRTISTYIPIIFLQKFWRKGFLVYLKLLRFLLALMSPKSPFRFCLLCTTTWVVFRLLIELIEFRQTIMGRYALYRQY